jgi:hypothetical protein
VTAGAMVAVGAGGRARGAAVYLPRRPLNMRRRRLQRLGVYRSLVWCLHWGFRCPLSRVQVPIIGGAGAQYMGGRSPR